MSASDPPAAARPEGADPVLDRCMLYDPEAIRTLLQQLIEKRCVLVATVEGDADGVVTAPLAIDEGLLWVDIPRDPATHRRMLRSQRLSFRGALDKVALRFASGPVVDGAHGGASALGVPLPARLLHLQRRELMRREPIPGSLQCLVYATSTDEADAPVQATIHDIGGGGLAILTPADAMGFTPGAVLPRCVITLPGKLGVVDVSLRVRHVRELARRSGQVTQAGCEFVELSQAAQSKLFRYLMQLDRDAMRIGVA